MTRQLVFTSGSTSTNSSVLSTQYGDSEDMVIEFDDLVNMTNTVKDLINNLSSRATDPFSSSSNAAKEFQFLFSKMQQRNIHPVTKTIEEEFAQSYIYTLGNISSVVMPSMNHFKKQSMKYIKDLERMRRHIERSIKRRNHIFEHHTSGGCPAGLDARFSNLLAIDSSSTSIRHWNLRDALKLELPQFVRLTKLFYMVIVEQAVEQEVYLSSVVAEHLSGFLKVWGVSSNEGVQPTVEKQFSFEIKQPQ